MMTLSPNTPDRLKPLRVGAIIQARLDSTRLCHKVFRPIGRRLVLDCVIDAAMSARWVNCVRVTTPDMAIYKYVLYLSEIAHLVKLSPHLHSGPRDPLAEFHAVASIWSLDLIVRLTADCPMVTAAIIDETVRHHIDKMPDIRYTYNQCDGADVEVFDTEALEQAFYQAPADQREHVTTWIRQHLPCQYLEPPAGEFHSVNTAEELELVRSLMGKEEAGKEAMSYGSTSCRRRHQLG